MFVFSVVREEQLSKEEMLTRGVFLLDEPRDIAPFKLRQGNGELFSNENLKGRWSYLFFGFTNCPDICPASMAVMAQAHRKLRESNPQAAASFQGVLVSVDPDRDDAAALKDYVAAFSPDFTGVTGPHADIAQLATQLNIAFAKLPTDDGGYTVDHSGQIVVVNPYGHYHGFIKMPHSAETIRLTHQTFDGSI